MAALDEFDRTSDDLWLLRTMRDTHLRWVRHMLEIYPKVKYEVIWKCGVLILHESVRRQLMMIEDDVNEEVKRAELCADMSYIWDLETFEFKKFPETAMRLVSSETIAMIATNGNEIDNLRRPFFDEIVAIPELRHEVFLECLAFL